MTVDPYTQYVNLALAVAGAVAPDLDVTDGSGFDAMLRGCAAIAASAESTRQQSLQQSSAATAVGNGLLQLGLDAGVQPLGQGFATVTVQFTGQAGAPAGGWVVNQGTRVWVPASTSAGAIIFTLQNQVLVPSSGTATGTAICTVPGASGNVAVGAITGMDGTPGVTVVTNLVAGSGGVTAETDDSYRQRILASRTVLYAAAQVQATAKGIPGCAFATLSDPKDGSGHSTLYAAQADGTLPSALQTLIQVGQHGVAGQPDLNGVNDVLPITETSTVTPFGQVHAVVAASILPAPGYDPSATQTAVGNAIVAYILTLGGGVTIQPGPMWSYVLSVVPGLYVSASGPNGDWYTTSPATPPAVATNQLFRLLAAPLAAILGAATATQAGVAASTASGTLPAGTYFCKLAWTTAAGDTLASPEFSVVLTGPGTITFTAPSAFPDTSVTGLKVFMGATAGSEKLQGTIAAASGTYAQSAALNTGSAAPITTNSISAPTVTVVAS